MTKIGVTVQHQAKGFMVAIMKGLMMGVAAVRDQQAAEKKRDGLGDDVNGDAEVVGCAGEQPADVALRAEPQSPPVGETGGEGLTGEPSGAAVTRRETRRFVEEGPGICDPEHLWMGKADGVSIRLSTFALSRSPTFKKSTTGPRPFFLLHRTSVRPLTPADELRDLSGQMVG